MDGEKEKSSGAEEVTKETDNGKLSEVVAAYEHRIADLNAKLDIANATIRDRDKTITLILNGNSITRQPDAAEFYKSLNI